MTWICECRQRASQCYTLRAMWMPPASHTRRRSCLGSRSNHLETYGSSQSFSVWIAAAFIMHAGTHRQVSRSPPSEFSRIYHALTRGIHELLAERPRRWASHVQLWCQAGALLPSGMLESYGVEFGIFFSWLSVSDFLKSGWEAQPLKDQRSFGGPHVSHVPGRRLQSPLPARILKRS